MSTTAKKYLKIGLTWGHFSDGECAVKNKCCLLCCEQCCRPSPAPRPLYFKY